MWRGALRFKSDIKTAEFSNDRPELLSLASRSGLQTDPEHRLSAAIGAFLALGVLVRLVRYLRCPPLWGDEAMVAVNVLDRGYLELLRPLQFFQVCPILFLWVERSAVELLGSSELALRLWPTICALASLFLFRHLAGRLFSGRPLLLALAFFAVAFYPIRHGGEVKPYAGDLFASTVLMTLAVEFLRRPDRSGWLWGLALVAPLCLGLSHPAVFVAGAVALATLPGVWQSKRRPVWLAYLAYLFGMFSTFLGLFWLSIRSMEEVRAGYQQGYWAQSFPPIGDPMEFLLWMLRMNTGDAFAYPVGGDRGASALTSLLFLIGAAWLWKQGKRDLLVLCLAPFALTFVAALLGRYPYGGSARTMQHIAPMVCLLAGLGAGVWLNRLRDARRRERILRLSMIVLASIGLVLLTRDLVAPQRYEEDERSRAFARWFWPELSRGAEIACVRSASGALFEDQYWNVGRLELYLTNCRFQTPPETNLVHPDLEAVSADRPLRCVLYNEGEHDPPALAVWLDQMHRRFELRDHRVHVVNGGVVTKGLRREERFEVFEFVPKSGSRVSQVIE